MADPASRPRAPPVPWRPRAGTGADGFPPVKIRWTVPILQDSPEPRRTRAVSRSFAPLPLSRRWSGNGQVSEATRAASRGEIGSRPTPRPRRLAARMFRVLERRVEDRRAYADRVQDRRSGRTPRWRPPALRGRSGPPCTAQRGADGRAGAPLFFAGRPRGRGSRSAARKRRPGRTPSASASLASMSTPRSVVPRSVRCTCRVSTSAASASCACVIPRRSRSRRTFAAMLSRMLARREAGIPSRYPPGGTR